MEAKTVLLWLVASTTLWLNTATSRSHFQPLLASVVNKTSGARQARIIGPNGYCVDVKGGEYAFNNYIIIWPCKEKFEDNQLWTFESDGTIRSNGWCLSAGSGTSVYLFDCDRHPTIWEMKDDGLVVVVANPTLPDEYVLTASSGEAEATLSIGRITFSSFQTWRFDDLGWRKRWGFIVGLHGLCLLSDGMVWMQKCDIFDPRQVWNFYPDGTLRPTQNSGACLTYEDDSKMNQRRVFVLRCGLYPTNERWWYTSDGTFLNEKDNLVLEMVDPKKIVASSPSGTPSQKWKIEKNRGGELF